MIGLNLKEKKMPAIILAAFITLSLSSCSSSPPEGTVKVPAGEFTMGSNEMDTEGKAIQYGANMPWFLNEHPAHKVTVEEFYISKTEITNKEYAKFIKKTGQSAPAHWEGGSYEEELADHPVVYVSWFDAKAYCEDAGAGLPTEAQWEKAARGTDGRKFPWGNEFDDKKLNTFGDFGSTTPVGKFPAGASPYGALDMSGNAQEWVQDSYKAYPGNDYKDKNFGDRSKVVRGGGWGGLGHYASQVYVRTANRVSSPPGGKYDDVGFRCVWKP